ncbi:MAG TPA: branched-chain amino acid ABC transporter permease [Solirubrobacteraceae bacterium]|jgi:branched-chain amino acid transport system permease protein
MNGTAYYVTTILVYLGVDIIAVWGLNLQYGLAGVYNFAFVMFQAFGAYIAAALTLGPSSGNGGFQAYILGGSLPWPLPVLAAGVASGLLALVVGLVALRKLRTDYQAMVMLVISVCATLLVTNDIGLFNGPAGLSLIPQPLTKLAAANTVNWQWWYVGATALICAIVYLFVHRVTSSPIGRALRAVRDNEEAAEALGKDVTRLRLCIFVFGNALAGISGAVLVQFIGAWSPGSWLYVETFVFLTAIIVGGTGNNLGVMLGALLVPVAFNEATRYLPQIGRPGLIDALQWIVIGLLALAFLWFWPRGIIPERRRRYPASSRAEV